MYYSIAESQEPESAVSPQALITFGVTSQCRVIGLPSKFQVDFPF